MSQNKRLTIIIVTFESAGIIATCLEKINFDKYEVFVVDNNSQDETTKIVEENFPKTNLIKLKQNIGYGRANNIALRKATTDYALIINPDAFMFEQDLDRAIEVLDQNPDCALAGPRTFHAYQLENLEQERQKLAQLKDEKRLTSVEFIVGGLMFMNMKIMAKIGFFDEDIFMFCEDNEVSEKSLENGYKNLVINDSFGFHIGAGSSKKSLRITYRKFWHLGWSKSHWKSKRRSWFSLKRATLRLALLYLFESLINFFKFNIEKVVSKFAFASGCFAHLIGLKAFNKNGKSRG